MRHGYLKNIVTAAAMTLLLAGGAVAQDDPAAAADRARAEEQRREAEARLEEARARLEEAAREIAELSLDMVGETQIVIREQMKNDLKPRRVLLGVNIGPAGGPDESGVRVQGVTPESAADAAGIRSGDVLLSIDGMQLDWSGDTDPQSKLLARLGEIEPGTRFKVGRARVPMNSSSTSISRSCTGRFRPAPRPSSNASSSTAGATWNWSSSRPDWVTISRRRRACWSCAHPQTTRWAWRTGT